MPFGTAHEASTPSCSRRRSQCIARARCSCTTKRGAGPAASPTTSPDGSDVRVKSRLASYSVSCSRDVPDFPVARLRGTSEHRQGVDGGAGAPRDDERRDHELELPPAEVRADRGRVLELTVVD